MLTCLAMAAALAASQPAIPALAQEIEAEARALTIAGETGPAFFTALGDFSNDAMALSDALRAAGVTQDLPCIFRGISEDAEARLEEFQSATTEAARQSALIALRVLLDDAILLAPIAAREAEGRARPEDHSASAVPELR